MARCIILGDFPISFAGGCHNQALQVHSLPGLHEDRFRGSRVHQKQQGSGWKSGEKYNTEQIVSVSILISG